MDLPARPAYKTINFHGSRSDAQIHQEGSRYGTTHVSGGSVFQGNFVGLTINSTASIRSEYEGQVSHSSLEPVKAYVLRLAIRDQIRKQLCDDAADESTNTLIVWGLGGVGKTQLVLDYVRRYRTDYKATFWIEAGRKESLERDFVNLYQILFGLQMVAGKETVSVDVAVAGVKSWFSGRRGPWLMVFDGADTIEEKDASEYVDIKHFIPDVASLHVIVTSRSSTAKDMTRLEGVQVGEMEEAQAAELFYGYSQLQRDSREVEEEINAIVNELGYLALAVTIAATYVGRTPRLQSDIKAYLPEYKRRRHDILGRKPESLIHQYGQSVLTTWETSYQAIQRQCPEASILMTMLSFLNFDDIFLQLFGTVSLGQTVDKYKIEECFELLQRYSLVQWKKDQHSYAMHKLVHAWGYDSLTVDDQDKYSIATFGLIEEAVDGCAKAPEDKLRLVPHVMANFSMLARAKDESDQMLSSTLDGLVSVGIFIAELGRWRAAQSIQEFVLIKSRRLLGEENPYTVRAMDNLALTLWNQGQLDKAVKIQKEVLAKRRRILGEDHLDTITAIHNLAVTLSEQDQSEEVAEIQKEVVEKRRRILGEEHIDTIQAMHNLAVTLHDQGQLDKAVQIKKEVLEKSRRILGEEHPDTITAIHNLAVTLSEQGQSEEVAEIQNEVVKKRRRILGEDHPDTIKAKHSFALTLRGQGQLEEAAKMQKEVLEKSRRILGQEHLDTIRSMANLAHMLCNQGQLDEAAEIQKEVLEKSRRLLGEDHPNTITVVINLAVTLGEQGHLEEAITLLEVAVPRLQRIRGEHHRHTKKAIRNLTRMAARRAETSQATALSGKKEKEDSLYARMRGKFRRKAT